MNPEYKFLAICVNVVDGDTADFEVDLGFRNKQEVRIRFARIDCPERKRPHMAAYNAAKDFLTELIEGKQVYLESEKTGKYGRWLGEIWRKSDGLHINDHMVKNGHAVYEEYD